MEETDYFDQSVHFDDEVHEKSSYTTASAEFSVNIIYSCTPKLSDWVILQESDEPQLLRTTDCPTETKFIRLNLEEFLNEEKARTIIADSLKLWLVRVESHPLLIDYALEKAGKVLKSMPSSHNSVILNLQVKAELRHVFYRNRFTVMATRRSMEEAKDGMVPAVDSSIESLESATLMESGSCAICLEEFVNGGEGVSMPCLHIFHGDCIKKWLRTSHYCPICRFQMPTS